LKCDAVLGLSGIKRYHSHHSLADFVSVKRDPVFGLVKAGALSALEWYEVVSMSYYNVN